MSLRFAKQIIYAAFFFIFWYLVISGVYHLAVKPAPTCFDSIQNQGEQGIDCGGLCALACTPSYIKQIEEVESVIKFDPDPTHFSLLAHIENQNSSYAAKIFNYRFSLYDDGGNVVGSYPGKSFIYGGEVKYILLPNVPYPKARFTKVDLKIDNPDWIPSEAFSGPPKLDVTSINTKVVSRMLAANGQIVNKDNVVMPKILIIAIFRGKYGQDAGVSQTEIDNLMPKTSQQFVVIHPLINNLDLAATEVFYYSAK
jgi:hypothetical protein